MARSVYFAFFLCVLQPLAAFAEIYRYTDENGVVHFGDRQVQNQQQEAVQLRGVRSDWQRYHIDVVAGDGVTLTDTERERIEADVNHVYRFFDDVLYFDIHRTVPVNILLLANKAAYDSFLSTRIEGSLPPSRGIFLGRTNDIVVYIREDREGTFRTIKHETGHAIVATLTPYLPAWLNEGLAEQMEMLTRSGDRLRIESHPENAADVRDMRDRNLMADVKAFLSMQSTDWRGHYRDKGYSLQSQTGEFVYFLLSSPTGRSFLTRLTHQYARGDRTLASYLVDEHYIGGMRVMQDNWALWLRGARKDALIF
ncbi:DUF4124 domain-containing protein [Marinobacter sp. BGYM27]|uniref:DUF4124 domain-containing protein n=1 Tax=Marinobacter sp. BGYM27 TaxID=2975597 RepID=UPI0021A9153F|nr:DUF4124 domain-containing protein [Marinobacter sp. BGYM27]MDG5500165.1 DUF4124 domain-containing protein [Marinobacter sp. BGYM27]